MGLLRSLSKVASAAGLLGSAGVNIETSPSGGRVVDGRKSFTYYSAYDAVKPKNKRQSPTGLVRDEDKELPPASRRMLVSGVRDIQRNFSVAAWAVRKHLDYVSTFNFKSRTGNAELDARVEELVEWAGRRENFDVAGRHDIHEWLRMSECRVTIDGDFFTLKLNTGQSQALEGDRIRTPYGGLPAYIDAQSVNHGVLTNASGKALAYVVCKRAKTNDMGYTGQDMIFERLIRAGWVYHHACWDSGRFDQVRGISPIASSLNQFRDVYENFDYALAKAKICQLFALAIYRDANPEEGALGEVESVKPLSGEEQEGGEGTEEEVDAKKKYGIDFGKGPLVLDLEAQDNIKVVESAQPSTQFVDFTSVMIGVALKSLDIPFSFYDESFTNYSGQRQALLMYEKSAGSKRRRNRDFLDNWTRWRLSMLIDQGVLVLPEGMTINDLKWHWRAAGLPWIDPLKETMADVAAVESGLNSPQRVLGRQGEDAYAILEDLAEWLKRRRALGLPDPVWVTGQTTAKQTLEETAPAEENEKPSGKAKGKGTQNDTSGRKSTTMERAYQVLAMDREEPQPRRNGDPHG